MAGSGTRHAEGDEPPAEDGEENGEMVRRSAVDGRADAELPERWRRRFARLDSEDWGPGWVE